jgi:integrase
MLIGQSAHPRAIMERMGHSTISVTLDTYGHLLPKIDAQLDVALDGVYRDAAGQRRADLRSA